METRYFSIQTDEYTISFKSMMPDFEPIEGIIIGVHGFCGDKESSAIEAVAKEMVQHRFGLICFDFPAHGNSKAKDEQFTVENCKRDFLKALDYVRKHFPMAEITIFATSFGGYVTLLCSDYLNDARIILRAPAVTMPEHILVDIIDISLEEYKRLGYVECGFDRKIKLPYAFYEELKQNSLMSKHFNREMTIIHGDLDDVVPKEDILDFCRNNFGAKLITIHGADHRYKNPGELEKVVDIVKKALLK